MNNENTINLVESITELTQQNTNLYIILVDIMKELSVIYPKHEIETLPAKVKEVVQQLTEAENKLHLLAKSASNAMQIRFETGYQVGYKSGIESVNNNET